MLTNRKKNKPPKQVFPATLLNEMFLDEDEEKSQKVMATILKMKKIEIKGLRGAFDQ